jgi:hypothetical protein
MHLYMYRHIYICYKLEGHRFDTLQGERFLSIYLIFQATVGPGVYSASNRKKYQKQKNNLSGKKSMAGA